MCVYHKLFNHSLIIVAWGYFIFCVAICTISLNNVVNKAFLNFRLLGWVRGPKGIVNSQGEHSEGSCMYY